MRKKISLKPFNSKVFLNDAVFEVNNGHNVFYGLKRYLESKSIEIHTVDLAKHSDVTFYADVPYPWRIDLWTKLLFSNRKKVLFVFESPLVNPFNHMTFLHYFFSKVYTWSEDFLIPQLPFKPLPKVNYNKKKYIILINANKNIPVLLQVLSPYRTNLYNKRLDAIQAFERLIPTSFDLYGKGWNGFSSFKGTIPEGKKLEVLSKYKFCLCFENAVAPGYLTEKLFDCFKAGVVPVYLGAPNVEKLVDPNSYIDMRRFSSYTSLLEYLSTITEKKYKQIQKSGETFLESKDYLSWTQERFFKLVLEEVKNT